MFYEQATANAELNMGDVAKTYWMLKHSRLPHKRVDELELKVDGDLARYNEIQLLIRMAKSEGHKLDPDGQGNYPVLALVLATGRLVAKSL